MAHLVYTSYSAASSLFYSEDVIFSAESVHQGDPLGPLLFCLTIHLILEKLESAFKVFYIDDGTIGGERQVVVKGVAMFEEEVVSLGLKVNCSKSELVCLSPDVIDL